MKHHPSVSLFVQNFSKEWLIENLADFWHENIVILSFFEKNFLEKYCVKFSGFKEAEIPPKWGFWILWNIDDFLNNVAVV